VTTFDNLNPVPLHALNIVPRDVLIGSKTAVQVDKKTIAVSPAMYELIMGTEDQEELAFLLRNIPVMKLPEGFDEVWTLRGPRSRGTP